MSVAGLSLSGLFLYQVNSQPLAHVFDTEVSAKSSPAPTALAAETGILTTGTNKAPIREVHIANNGLVFLRGARVTSISNETIKVEMAWDQSGFVWTLETGYNTQFTGLDGKEKALSDIQVGDTVNVTGMLKAGGTELVIDTQFVRKK